MQDCMEFLNNLLLNNAPNQLMFRCCTSLPMCRLRGIPLALSPLSLEQGL